MYYCRNIRKRIFFISDEAAYEYLSMILISLIISLLEKAERLHQSAIDD